MSLLARQIGFQPVVNRDLTKRQDRPRFDLIRSLTMHLVSDPPGGEKL